MSNILNHNRSLFDVKMCNEDYWDFSLCADMSSFTYDGNNGSLTTRCLSSYIDINDPICQFLDQLLSKEGIVWDKAINEGGTLYNIGYTGFDNGLLTFEKDIITNKEFLDMFFKSIYDLNKDDLRLQLHKVEGNNQIYDYYACVVPYEEMDVLQLNGGWYQGFFKVLDYNYQTLPHLIDEGWGIEFTLNKQDLEHDGLTLNDVHPENKGIFFYIGTRAENKWYYKYLLSDELHQSPNFYLEEGVFEDDYQSNDGNVNAPFNAPHNEDVDPYSESDYIADVFQEDCKPIKEHYWKDGYVDEDYTQNGVISCDTYASEDYIEEEEVITGNEPIKTSDGFDVYQPNIIRYETDNKFILFDRTCEGFNVDNWVEGEKALIYDIKDPDIGNYFELFNRTCNGYTTDTIDKVKEVENKRYNILKDLYRNALAFQIKDDGSIGYKYLVRDCDSEKEHAYKIESEFSNPDIVTNDNWHTVSIQIKPIKVNPIYNPYCSQTVRNISEEMQIYFYVDGQLRLVSKRLPILNLKGLDDLETKQETVPYNISIGGGTQGLADVININYRQLPQHLLPLEKEFGGSFIGLLKDFRFYSCPLSFQEIQQNHLFDQANMNKTDDSSFLATIYN